MLRLAVIGAGQLGVRHLQALALLDRAAEIFVVDPRSEALRHAREQFNAVEGRNEEVTATYSNNIRGISGNLDVAIIATTADVRLDVVKAVVSRLTVRHMILEKVLFQGVPDYPEAEGVFALAGTLAWVNCPRRVWPHYVALRRALGGKKVVSVHLGGSNWGLACNSIHMLDLVAFFNGLSALALDTSHLDPDPIPAKRLGFLEFTGTLAGHFADECKIELESLKQEGLPSIVDIETLSSRYRFDEALGKMWQSEKANDAQWHAQTISVPYQSRLTHLIVQDLIDKGECGLTPLADSARLHVPLISALLGHLRRQADYRALERCPIT
jgi:hypothetical protein